MLCKFGGWEGRTKNQIHTSVTQVREFLWTQVQQQPQVLSPLSGLCFSAWSIPETTKAIEVVDISRVPASAQMEFSTLLLLQILIKALTSQQWTHCLVKSKQFLAASQGPGGPPELGHGALGSTSALGSPPTPLLQLVALCRVKGNGCFEPGTGSHTEGPHPTVHRRATDRDPLLCCGEEGPAWKSALGLPPAPGGRPSRPRPACTCPGVCSCCPAATSKRVGTRSGQRPPFSQRAPPAHGV